MFCNYSSSSSSGTVSVNQMSCILWWRWHVEFQIERRSKTCESSQCLHAIKKAKNKGWLSFVSTIQGFSKYWWPMKRVGYFAWRNWLLFSLKEEAKNIIIIKSEWKHKGPLVLWYALLMQTLYFSQRKNLTWNWVTWVITPVLSRIYSGNTTYIQLNQVFKDSFNSVLKKK